MTIKRFEEIESWKKAPELTKSIYTITKQPEFSKDYGLKDQLQRASVSVMANIAEGFGSGSKKSFIVFLNYAYRSACETQALLYVASDCGYIGEEEFMRMYTESDAVKSMIGGFIQYLRKRNNEEQSNQEQRNQEQINEK